VDSATPSGCNEANSANGTTTTQKERLLWSIRLRFFCKVLQNGSVSSHTPVSAHLFVVVPTSRASAHQMSSSQCFEIRPLRTN
jgi:hypothetical protein